jgi:phage portal protein BeeE
MKNQYRDKAAIVGGVHGTKAVSLQDVDNFLDWLVGGEGDKPQDLYQAVAYIFWCTRLRANNIARVPYWILPMEDEDDDEERQVEFGIDLRPFLWMAEAWLTLKGAAYWLKLLERRTLDDLQVLNANTMSVKAWDAWGNATSFEQRVGVSRQTFTADEVVYFRTWNPRNDIREGIASGAVAQRPGALIKNANEWAAAFFENGAIPAVLLTTEGAVPPVEKTRIESAWQKMFQGVQRAFKTAVLERGLTPTVVGQPIKDLAMPQLEQSRRIQILAAHDLPPGLADPKTNRAERDALQFELWDQHLIPYIETFVEPVVNKQLLEPLGLRLSFQYQQLEALQEKELQKAESMAFAIGGVILPAYKEGTVNVAEVRSWIDSVGQAAGLPPLDENWEPEEPEPMPPQLVAAQAQSAQEEPETTPIEERIEGQLSKAILDDLNKWERKALSRIKEGYPLKALEFASDAIPALVHQMIVHSLEHATTIGDVIEVFKAARGEKQIQFIPEGQGDPLPPVPDEVVISDADIDRAIKSWDKLMPEFAGLLDAEVIHRENYDAESLAVG